jgi:hypothetical protein
MVLDLFIKETYKLLHLDNAQMQSNMENSVNALAYNALKFLNSKWFRLQRFYAQDVLGECRAQKMKKGETEIVQSLQQKSTEENGQAIFKDLAIFRGQHIHQI